MIRRRQQASTRTAAVGFSACRGTRVSAGAVAVAEQHTRAGQGSCVGSHPVARCRASHCVVTRLFRFAVAAIVAGIAVVVVCAVKLAQHVRRQKHISARMNREVEAAIDQQGLDSRSSSDDEGHPSALGGLPGRRFTAAADPSDDATFVERGDEGQPWQSADTAAGSRPHVTAQTALQSAMAALREEGVGMEDEVPEEHGDTAPLLLASGGDAGVSSL